MNLELNKKYIIKAFNAKPLSINTKVVYLGKEGSKLKFKTESGKEYLFTPEQVEEWNLKLLNESIITKIIKEEIQKHKLTNTVLSLTESIVKNEKDRKIVSGSLREFINTSTINIKKK